MQDEHSERGCTEYQESLKEEKRPSQKAVQASFEGHFCALPLRMLCAEVPLEVEFNEIFFLHRPKGKEQKLEYRQRKAPEERERLFPFRI